MYFVMYTFFFILQHEQCGTVMMERRIAMSEDFCSRVSGIIKIPFA